MNRRRIFFVTATTLVPLAVIIASCTFPDLGFVSTDDGGLPESSTADNQVPTTEAGADAADGGLPPDVDPDGGAQEGGLVDVIVVDTDAGCCDCDNDKYNDDAGDASCPVKTGWGDCDDGINAIHPGIVGFVTNTSWPSKHTPSFDWDCDGTKTKQFNHDLPCAPLAVFGIGCSNAEGFMGDPACGESAQWYKCVTNGALSCGLQAVTNDIRTQGCR